MEQYRPLAGLKVVEMSLMVASASCGRMLTDWGASVIKVESTKGGDNMRRWPMTIGAPIEDGFSPIFDNLNACKRGLSVDTTSPEGQEIMYKLLSEADVFITNLRTQALKKSGLDYDTLKDKFPKLVMAQLEGYGPKGPDAAKPGYDNTAFWARSGFMYSQALYEDENCYPVYMPMGFGDVICGMGMMAGVMAAVVAAQETGKGDHVSLSLYGTALWLENVLVSGAQYQNKFPKKRSTSSPFGCPYKCKDGRWIMPQIVILDKDAPAYYRLMEAEDLLEDPRYLVRANFNNEEFNKPIVERFEKVYAKRTAAEWKELFEAEGFSYEILYNYSDILTDEQAKANDFIYEMTYDNGQTVPLVRPSLKSERMGLSPFERGPMLGEHTTEILKELGYSDDKVKELIEAGKVSQHA